MTTPLMSCVVHYRDDRGALREVRVESSDPAELERVTRLVRAMERRNDAGERRFRNGHVTFTDLGVDPGSIAKAKAPKPARQGYPWEGPRFSFALLLGESPTWSGEGSLWLWETDGASGRWVCRFCGHYGDELPVVAYCLGCDRSGRDRAIPAGVARTERKCHRKGKLKGGKS